MYTEAFRHKANNPLVDTTAVPCLAECCWEASWSLCTTHTPIGVTCCSAECHQEWVCLLSVLSDEVKLTLIPDQDAWQRLWCLLPWLLSLWASAVLVCAGSAAALPFCALVQRHWTHLWLNNILIAAFWEADTYGWGGCRISPEPSNLPSP